MTATLERLPGTRRRHEDGFLWISGATYPHRATLRAHGFRWNDIRRAWYAPEEERQAPPPPRAVTAGPYAGSLRNLAHEVKAGSGLEEAARRLAPFVPPRVLLVPMPGRTGQPGALALLAAEVAKRAPGVDVLDALRSNAHPSGYEEKKRHAERTPLVMETIRPIPAGRPVWILDNVIDTGATARAALRAIPGATLLALASTANTPERWRAEAGRLF